MPMTRPRLLALLSAIWFAAVLLNFHFGPGPFQHGGLPFLLLDIVLLTLIASAAWGLGSAMLRPLRLDEDSPLEAPLFALGAGLGGLALITFVLSATGLLYRPVVVALLAGCVLLLYGVMRHPGPHKSLIEPFRSWGQTEIGLLLVPLIAGLVTLTGTLAPPEFYDSLIYHLAVPDRYIRSHAMVPLEGNYYSHFPANMGMLYAIGLLLRGGELAQSIHWLCGVAAVLTLFVMARRCTDRMTALVACILLSLTPGVMLIATYAISDLGVTLFGTLCFAAVLHLWDGADRRWLVAAGLFAGLAAGTKYTAAIVVCAPAAVAIALRPDIGRRQGHRRRALLDTAVFIGAVVVLLAPWMGRNLVFTGNPLAPYFDSVGSPSLAEEMQRRLPDQGGAWALLGHFLLAPWSVTMKRLGAGGYLGPAFLMLIPLVFFMRRLPRAVLPLSLMAGIGFVGWALTVQVTRYLMPVLPLLALLAAISARRIFRPLAVGALSWSLLYNLLLFFSLIETIGSYRVVTGAETRESYLSRRVSYYPAVSFLAELPADERVKVLFVGEGRGFYCPRDYVASTPLDSPILERYAEKTQSEEGLVAALRMDGFTHLLVSDPELRRTRGLAAGDVMREHFPTGSPVLLFEKNGVIVYRLP